MALRICATGLLAVAMLGNVGGCYGPFGGRFLGGHGCRPDCLGGDAVEYCAPYPAAPAGSHDAGVAEVCPPGHARRYPVRRLAQHLKPHGALQPQVPVAPLPKFHPLPTRPVFEPSYFDTMIGPEEVVASP